MTGKAVIPSEAALGDVREAVLNYRQEAGERVVSNFLAVLEYAFRFIEETMPPLDHLVMPTR